jgi:hypothetical protein
VVKITILIKISIFWILGIFTMTMVYGGLSYGGIDWINICEKAPDFLLSTSCNELVNDDNELTPKGERELLSLAAPLAGTLRAIWTNSTEYW